MRIPLEHFCTTPDFALSPSGHDDHHNNKRSNEPSSINSSNNNKFSSLIHTTSNTCKDKKMTLPDSLGLLSLQSVGSAPNSPGLSRRTSSGPGSGLPTVSGVVGFACNSNNTHGPISLPSAAAMITKNPYATLPKK
jgi:hypothetical protein